MSWKRIVLMSLCFLVGLPVLAQGDTETVMDITYDTVVDDTITQQAFYDWWVLGAAAGDMVVVDMTAADGLEPLLGILDTGGTLVARSDDGAPDSSISLEYTIPAPGRYVIVATRVGNADGTSTGTYSLQVRRANGTVVNVDPYQDVIFRCDDYEAMTAATVTFAEDPQPGLVHRITVYGIDGFQPVIRLHVDEPEVYEVCNTDAEFTLDDMFTLPGEEARTVTADTINMASQHLISGAENVGLVTITIGSRDGIPGRYMAIFDQGFTIDPADDVDTFEVRIGPRAAETTALAVYMVAAQNSRLDPFMTLSNTGETCDDAGRSGCETLPTFTGAGAVLHEGDRATLRGDRSDAGMLFKPGNPDPISIQLSSRDGDTHGEYAVVVIGELPPRD